MGKLSETQNEFFQSWKIELWRWLFKFQHLFGFATKCGRSTLSRQPNVKDESGWNPWLANCWPHLEVFLKSEHGATVGSYTILFDRYLGDPWEKVSSLKTFVFFQVVRLEGYTYLNEWEVNVWWSPRGPLLCHGFTAQFITAIDRRATRSERAATGSPISGHKILHDMLCHLWCLTLCQQSMRHYNSCHFLKKWDLIFRDSNQSFFAPNSQPFEPQRSMSLESREFPSPPALRRWWAWESGAAWRPAVGHSWSPRLGWSAAEKTPTVEFWSKHVASWRKSPPPQGSIHDLLILKLRSKQCVKWYWSKHQNNNLTQNKINTKHKTPNTNYVYINTKQYNSTPKTMSQAEWAVHGGVAWSWLRSRPSIWTLTSPSLELRVQKWRRKRGWHALKSPDMEKLGKPLAKLQWFGLANHWI